MESEEVLASTVKQLHAKLRKLTKTGDANTVWQEHLADKPSLQEYSDAMRSLAIGPWQQARDKEGNRIAWCVDVCEEYFARGTLAKLLLKDLRRTVHQMPTLVPLDILPKTEEDVSHLAQCFNSRKLFLLDVGSCYNPFKKFPQFEVTAIDIAPADKSVHWCDFMNIKVVNEDTPHELSSQAECSLPAISSMKSNSFDIVVFSLLLSYLPLPLQRLKCIINAHRVLSIHGLLLIITPDSSHQNKHAKMMKSWKTAIEAIGFHRWKYVKETHLHCLAFRKTSHTLDYSKQLESFHQMMFIPQDSHEDSEEHSDVGNVDCSSSYTEVEEYKKEMFQELPLN